MLLSVFLIAGLAYLIMREDPGDPPPVPSPNFKTETPV